MKTPSATPGTPPRDHHLRFHLPHRHLNEVFGQNWFALKAEAFARFFGTPFFLVAQTVIVLIWIALNAVGVFHFDVYPFILLNLAFSLQAAYAAPLILLAQTRQADRDKAHAGADALHREDLAKETLSVVQFIREPWEPMPCTAKTSPKPVKSGNFSAPSSRP